MQENYSNDLDGAKCLEFIRLATSSLAETIEFRQSQKFSISKYKAIYRELKELDKTLLTYLKHHNNNF